MLDADAARARAVAQRAAETQAHLSALRDQLDARDDVSIVWRWRRRTAGVPRSWPQRGQRIEAEIERCEH